MIQQVNLGDLILLTIKRMGINGEGIGYYKRQAIFVDGALVGEEVEVEITSVKDGFAYGEITKFKKTSPNRTTPKCPYFGKCGGCQHRILESSTIGITFNHDFDECFINHCHFFSTVFIFEVLFNATN